MTWLEPCLGGREGGRLGRAGKRHMSRFCYNQMVKRLFKQVLLYSAVLIVIFSATILVRTLLQPTPTFAAATYYYHDGMGELSDADHWWDNPFFVGGHGVLPSGAIVGVISTGTATVSSSFDLTFALQVQGGTLSILSGGTLTLTTANMSNQGTGIISVASGGSLVINSGRTILIDNINADNINIASGGTLNIASGGTLSVTKGISFNQYNPSWTINGTLTFADSEIISSGYTWTVASTGILNINAGTFTVDSGGTLNKITGGTITVFSNFAKLINNNSTSYEINGIPGSAITAYLLSGVTNYNATNYNAVLSLTPNSWSASGLPTGLSIDSGTGQITGTPSSSGLGTILVTGEQIAIGHSTTTQAVSYSFTPPIPGIPDLTSGSDTGASSTDNITNDNTPTFTVTCTGTNTIEIYSPSGTLRGAGACSGGSASVTSSVLTDGTYSFLAKQGDGVGTSTYSSGLDITVDTEVPIFSSVTPTSSSFINNVTTSSDISFTLNEALASGTTTITQTSGIAPAMPFVCLFTGNILNAGAHVMDISDTVNNCTYGTPITGISSNAYHTFLFAGKDVAGNIASSTTRTLVRFDTSSPTISEVTPIVSGTNANPSYTFTTSEAGTISYGGSCSSGTTSATSGSNTIIFNTLSPGTYSNCTITVTDLASNISNVLSVASFTIIDTAPSISVSYGRTGGSSSGGTSVSNVSANIIPSVNNNTETTFTYLENFKYIFTRNLFIGARGADVLALQRFLNLAGYTVSTKGAGSKGRETMYFGPATRGALALFQKDSNIKPDKGYFGAITRALVNKLLNK